MPGAQESGSECVVSQSLGIDFAAFEINEEYADFAHKWLRRSLQ